MAKTTDELLNTLRSAEPESLSDFFSENKDRMMPSKYPFAFYLRELLGHYGITQREILEKAGFSLTYGYRLLSEERHTKQRDYILRICIAAGFTLEETQRLLTLYGMSPLYPRFPRDAVLINAISAHITDICKVNEMLEKQKKTPLKASVPTGDDPSYIPF